MEHNKEIISLTKVCTNVEMFLEHFTESFPKLMKHEANQRHQYQVLTQLKNDPSEDKVFSTQILTRTVLVN